MCNEKKQNSNQAYSVKSGNTNKFRNKQSFSKVGDMCSNETRSVDFQIHTNIELNYNKKIQICFFISSFISFVCIFGSFFATYKLNKELTGMQHQLTLLNKKLVLLSETCDSLSDTENILANKLTEDDENAYETITSTDKPGAESSEDVSAEYDYETEDTFIKSINRSRRANHRNRQANQRLSKRSGPLAVHFKGSVPEKVIENRGLIGPWYPDHTVARQYKFTKFHLTEDKCSIEVTEPGLYFIYAQVYYITSYAVNSYALYVKSEGTSQDTILARCSANGPNSSHDSEISCYTSAVYNLRGNDRLFIKQMERNRTVLLRDGYSFFGIVRLNNSRRGRA